MVIIKPKKKLRPLTDKVYFAMLKDTDLNKRVYWDLELQATWKKPNANVEKLCKGVKKKCFIVKEEHTDKEIFSYDRFQPSLYRYMP